MKQLAMGALSSLHGIVGAADTVDVLAFELAAPGTSAGTTAEAILRVPAEYGRQGGRRLPSVRAHQSADRGSRPGGCIAVARAAARLQAALTVLQQFDGKPCRVAVVSRSGALVALAVDRDV